MEVSLYCLVEKLHYHAFKVEVDGDLAHKGRHTVVNYVSHFVLLEVGHQRELNQQEDKSEAVVEDCVLEALNDSVPVFDGEGIDPEGEEIIEARYHQRHVDRVEQEKHKYYRS